MLKYVKQSGKELDRLTEKDIQSYLMGVLDCVSPAMVNGWIRVYKVFYKHPKEEGFIDQNPLENVKLVKRNRRLSLSFLQNEWQKY